MEPATNELKKPEENKEAVVEKEEENEETVNKPDAKKKGRKSVIIKTVPEVVKESIGDVDKKVDAKKGRRKSMAVVEDAPAKFVPTKLDDSLKEKEEKESKGKRTAVEKSKEPESKEDEVQEPEATTKATKVEPKTRGRKLAAKKEEDLSLIHISEPTRPY